MKTFLTIFIAFLVPFFGSCQPKVIPDADFKPEGFKYDVRFYARYWDYPADKIPALDERIRAQNKDADQVIIWNGGNSSQPGKPERNTVSYTIIHSGLYISEIAMLDHIFRHQNPGKGQRYMMLQHYDPIHPFGFSNTWWKPTGIRWSSKELKLEYFDHNKYPFNQDGRDGQLERNWEWWQNDPEAQPYIAIDAQEWARDILATRGYDYWEAKVKKRDNK